MADLDDYARLSAREQGLAVISTVRADGSVQSSLVNAGIIAHPITDNPCLAFVTYGVVKLANLRRHPQLAATIRSGWEWVGIEGNAEIIRPDDPHPTLDPEQLRRLLREIFTCAGGTHDDWDEYDHVMIQQRRAAVLVDPVKVYSNPRR